MKKYLLILMLLGAIPAFAQRPVTGRVTDSATGEPLMGVNVVQKGAQGVGTITDIDGNYSLAVPENAVLTFSYVGYITQEMKAASAKNVALAEDYESLDEIVVIGYGTAKRRDLTGAITSVSGDQLLQSPANRDVLTALQGKVPGLQISNYTAKPGGGDTRVRLRGTRSVNASNTPLYVVDGIAQTMGVTDISTADIESVEVLKDASATAIYGSRGANGVIIITTKQGKAGKVKVDYNGQVGFQTRLRTVELFNSPEWIEWTREAYRNTSTSTQLYDSDVASYDYDLTCPAFTRDSYVMASVMAGWNDDHTEWDASKVPDYLDSFYDAIYRTGFVTDHNLSVNGGTDKTQYNFSTSYYKNDGIVYQEDYERYNFRVNLTQHINKYVTVGTQMQYSHSLRNAGTSTSYKLIYMVPASPWCDEDGNWIDYVGGYSTASPMGDIYGDTCINQVTRNRFSGTYFLEVKAPFLEGLTWRSNLGLDFLSQDTQTYYASNTSQRMHSTPSSSWNHTPYNMMNWENILSYNKTIGDHSFGITGVQSIQTHKNEALYLSARDFASDDVLWYAMADAGELVSYSTGINEWQMASFMARVNYSYKDRYLLTASARWDGASMLAEGNKWQMFPSVSLAWRINEEAFLRDVDWITNLKIRAGFGKTGNSSVDAYSTLGNLSSKVYGWDMGNSGATGYAVTSMANQDLGWETTDQWNVGVDFGFLGGRLSGSVDLYLQNTYDLILDQSLPSVSGFTEVQANVGQSRNKGIELAISSVNIKNRNFTWTTDFTFSYNKEELVELASGREDDIASGWFIGHPINVHYDYKKIGIWQNTDEDLAEMAKFNANGHAFEPGDIKIEDVDGDYMIESDDKQILGSARPKAIFGLTNTFTYKDFDLSFFLYANTGALYYAALYTGGEVGRMNSRKFDYWTYSNPTNEGPRPCIDEQSPDYQATMEYSKADFLRVKYITLGYNLPKSFCKKMKIEKFRLYVTAKDPFLWTGYMGAEPEAQYDSGNNTYTNMSGSINAYSLNGFNQQSVSTWMFGVNLTL